MIYPENTVLLIIRWFTLRNRQYDFIVLAFHQAPTSLTVLGTGAEPPLGTQSRCQGKRGRVRREEGRANPQCWHGVPKVLNGDDMRTDVFSISCGRPSPYFLDKGI